MAATIKEFAKEQKLSQSIYARLHPYQRLSASTHQQYLDAARSWKNSRSHSNCLKLTSHGSHQQRGHQTVGRRISSTCESPTSIRVQEKERGQESAVSDEYFGHDGNVHVMCLTFKTIQNDTAQYINEWKK